MITVLAKLTAQPGKEAEMLAALERMVADVDAAGPGVGAYRLHTVEDEPGTFYLYEQYQDAEVQEAHRTTDHMKALGMAMRDIAAGRPEITRLKVIADVKR